MSIRILDVLHDTMVDGPGFRTTIYCAGCPNHCKGCHNPQSWDPQGGTERTIDSLADEIMADPFADVTFSGGDPMAQAEGFAELARAIRRRSKKTIWCYTGFIFETLLAQQHTRSLLEELDVLVDGPFIEAEKDADLLFRGSANQRIIDVRASLREGKTIEWTPDSNLY